MTWRARFHLYGVAFFVCIALPILWAFNKKPLWLRDLIAKAIRSIPDEALTP